MCKRSRTRQWATGVPMLALLAILTATSIGRADDLTEGKEIYEMRCVLCHGPDGRGDGPAGMVFEPPPADLSLADYWKTKTPEQVRDAIVKGKPGTAMVPFGQMLSSSEIDSLLAYLRSFAP